MVRNVKKDDAVLGSSPVNSPVQEIASSVDKIKSSSRKAASDLRKHVPDVREDPNPAQTRKVPQLISPAPNNDEDSVFGDSDSDDDTLSEQTESNDKILDENYESSSTPVTNIAWTRSQRAPVHQLRQRKGSYVRAEGNTEPGGTENAALKSVTDGEDSKVILLSQDSSKKKWTDYWTRLVTTFLMIFAFLGLMMITKQPGIVFLVFVCQVLIYRELVMIRIKDAREKALPGFSLLYTYWFVVGAFFLYCRILYPYFFSALTTPKVTTFHSSLFYDSNVISMLLLAKEWLYASWLWILQRYVTITYFAYSLSVVLFVFSLKNKRAFKYQFSQMAFCHIAILAVVWQSTLLTANAYTGLFWFAMPCALVVCNDSFAYLSGFFFGRTPLTRLSPKKTVEGFIGGALATIVFGVLATQLCQTLEWGNFKWLMLCPVRSGFGFQTQKCDIDTLANGIFVPRDIHQFAFAQNLPSWTLMVLPSTLSEAQLHVAAMSVFASMIAPFFGFLASGLKRTFKIKDFSDTIPGHGGITDRMDCQLMMGSFAYVYVHFIIPGFSGNYEDASLITSKLTRLPIPIIMEIIQQLQAYVDANT